MPLSLAVNSERYNCYDFRGCFGYNWSSKTEAYRIAR